MVLFAASVLVLIAAAMFVGWGWAFLKLFRLGLRDWARTAVIGMAALVCIGGILNLARLAYPSALAAIAGTGLVLAVFAWREGFEGSSSWLAIAVSAAIVIFTIATQLPPSIYNFHDDFQKYLAYPVRMVETGTVFGSPLSAMGLQTLGAQAFLHGFVVAFFPIIYINGVDAVLGLFLCLMLATRFAKGWIAAACVLAVVVINPQYVNISTLYLGSALMMAMVAESFDESPSAVALGLLAAALVAMKPIYLIFVAIHFVLVGFVEIEGIKNGLRWIVRAGIAAGIFLSPWVVMHAPNYLASKHHTTRPTPAPDAEDTDAINLVSFEPLEYGATAVNYTALVASFAICGVICRSSRKMIASCASAVAAFFVFVYVLGPMNYGYNHALRYYVPVAIAVAPAVFGFAASYARSLWVPIAVVAIALVAFAPSAWTRATAAVKLHTVASYSWLVEDPEYVDYNRRVLFGTEKQDVASLQNRVPAGERILAWMDTPFYLDYRRNKIFDIDTAGIAVPWAEVPPAGYLIWDYGGFATPDRADFEGRLANTGANERRDSALTLDFIKRLDGMVGSGKVLYDDGEVMLVKLAGKE